MTAGRYEPKEKECRECGGFGQVYIPVKDSETKELFDDLQTCPDCNGSGVIMQSSHDADTEAKDQRLKEELGE